MNVFLNNKEFRAMTSATAVALGGLQGNPQTAWRDQYDAYRHAMLAAQLTKEYGEDVAYRVLSLYERLNGPNDDNPRDSNMDLYNNRVGQLEYLKWKAAFERGDTSDSIEKWLYDAVKNGVTVNDLSDPRVDPRTFIVPPANFTPADDGLPVDPMGYIPLVISPVTGSTPDPRVREIRLVDPLVLDLNGDGFNFLPLDLSAPILFDADANGVRTSTAWASPADGFVVLDRNGNGTIDSGREMFGDQTMMSSGELASHGFSALRDFDGNADGIINIADSAYSRIKIWRDLNSDGVSQATELSTLRDSGISSIGLASEASHISYGDAQAVQFGTFTRSDGSAGQAGSFVLATSDFRREFTPIELSDAAYTIRQVAGTGWVRDLREAATDDPRLIELVRSVESAATFGDYRTAVANLIRLWGSTSDPGDTASGQAMAAGYGLILSDPQDAQERGWMDVAVKGTNEERSSFRSLLNSEDLIKFDAMRERMVGGLERLHAYEAFTAHPFLNWQQILGDAVSYQPRVSLGGRVPVVALTPLSQIINEHQNGVMSSEPGYVRVTIPQPLTGDQPHLDALWQRLVSDASANLLKEFRLEAYLRSINLDISGSEPKYIFDQFDATLDAALSANAYEGSMLIIALQEAYGAGLESMGWNGEERVQLLMERALADSQVRQAFADSGSSYGMPGAIEGTSGVDFYLGDANSNVFSARAGNDWLYGMDNRDVLYGGLGDDQVIGGLGNDEIFGEDGNDVLNGGDGEDRISDGWGDDSIFGGAGNDMISIGEGQNLIEGGLGDDQIYHGYGTDTYIFGLGDGHDVISSSVPNSTSNTLRFGQGISPVDVNLSQYFYAEGGFQYPNLLLSLNSSFDTVLVRDFFISDWSSLQRVVFADGTVWDAEYIRRAVYGGSGGDDTIRGTSMNDVLGGGTGNDLIFGAAGSDNLSGGSGDDTLYGASLDHQGGSDGDDVIDGGEGDDYLNGGFGNNTYLFGRGDGFDTINHDVNTGVNTTGCTNTLQFKSGVSAADIIVEIAYDPKWRGNEALRFTIADTGEFMLVGSYFPAGGENSYLAMIQEVRFADGVVWNRAALDAVLKGAVNGTDEADVLSSMSGGRGELFGFGGADTIFGSYRGDILDGGAGGDAMYGRGGGDNYWVDDQQDVVHETAEAGWDVVNSSISWKLAENVESLTLVGNESIDGEGNGLGNSIFGNAAANSIDGNGGQDYLAGGAGDDSYWVDDAEDTVFENFGEGHDVVFSTTSYSLGSETEDLILSGDAVNAFGNELANILRGNGLQNTIGGGAGDDTLDGGSGSDTLIGGTGNDIYVVDVSSDVVQESSNAGADTVFSVATFALSSNVESLVLLGSAGINGTGNSLANNLTGNSGNNSLNGGSGADSMAGGVGDDTYVVDNSADAVTERANEGTDLVQSSVAYTLTENTENLTLTGSSAVNATGNALANTLTGNSAANTLTGDAGNDVLNGGSGIDTMRGGTGDDTYGVDNAADVLTENENEGTDSVQAATSWTLGANFENLTLTRVGGGDSATGNALNNVLTGSSGANRIDGGAGADRMSGGAGNDTYVVDTTGDVVVEAVGEGSDTVESAINYTLGANIENVTLTGTDALNASGNALGNVLRGNAGNNVLDGGAGADAMYGGTGDDVFRVDNTGDVINERADEGTDRVEAGIGYTLGITVENLTLTGSSAIDGTGNSVANVLVGNAAANKLDGAAGDDTLDGGAGADTLVGGRGNDVFIVDDAGDSIRENAAEGTDTVRSSVGWTLATNLENLSLIGTAAINGTGNTLANALSGNTGSNVLTGLAGADTLDGGAGIDTLNGGAGADTYLFARGHGQDTVQDNDTTSGVKDKVQFAAGIAQADLTYSHVGNNLEALINGTSDKLVFQDWYLGNQYHVEEFRFSDGTVQTDAQVQGLVSAMAGFNAPTSGIASAASMRHGFQTTNLAVSSLM